MALAYAEAFSTLWSHTPNGVRFDSGKAIRKKCYFRHIDNSRIWVAHCRRDCRLLWEDNQQMEANIQRQFDGYIFVFLSVGVAEKGHVALAH